MAPHSDQSLMAIQVATLFRHDERARIVATNEPNPSRAPRLFVGRTRDGLVWRCRDDVPDDLAAEIGRLLAREPLDADLDSPPVWLDVLVRLLEWHAPVGRIWLGPAYYAPPGLAMPPGVVPTRPADAATLAVPFPEWASEVEGRQPCIGVVRNGAAVAICGCARCSPVAAEAGVETREAFRGRGFATAAVAAWVEAVRRSGRIPLYSTSHDNVASRAIARRLGLVRYGSDLSLA